MKRLLTTLAAGLAGACLCASALAKTDITF